MTIQEQILKIQRKVKNLSKAVCCIQNQENNNNNQSYQKYVALLSQSGSGNPIATILENTIGNIVWTRQAQGQYIGTLVGAFVNNKTACFGNFQLLTTDCTIMHIGRQSNDIVKYKTYEDGINLNEQNGDVVVEIRIYP